MPTATSADASPTTPGREEKCYAELTDRRREGWVAAGTMIVTSRAGHAVSIELRDTSGRVVESTTLAKESDLLSKPCKVGGVLVFSERKPALDGPSTFTVLRPSAQDPSADVVSLCTKPAEVTVDSNGGAPWAFVRDAYADRLTSARWRKWLYELDEALHRDELTAKRAKREMGDELEAAAKAAGLRSSCWMLRFL